LEIKKFVKSFLNRICQAIALPFIAGAWLEQKMSPSAEVFFQFGSQAFAFFPGLPGVFLRRAYYSLTLTRCSLHCHIGFGSIFSHREAIIDDNVSIGAYNIIGSAHIKEKTFIASRVSFLSGKTLHTQDDHGEWTPYDPSRMEQIRIGPNAWIGEGAVIMADVGEGSLVGAGAVVTERVAPHVVVAGNPAKYIKDLKISEDR